jgi:hypothetical protein
MFDRDQAIERIDTLIDLVGRLEQELAAAPEAPDQLIVEIGLVLEELRELLHPPPVFDFPLRAASA